MSPRPRTPAGWSRRCTPLSIEGPLRRLGNFPAFPKSGWTHTLLDYAAADPAGHPYIYFVTEATTPGFTTAVTSFRDGDPITFLFDVVNTVEVPDEPSTPPTTPETTPPATPPTTPPTTDGTTPVETTPPGTSPASTPPTKPMPSTGAYVTGTLAAAGVLLLAGAVMIGMRLRRS